MKLKELLNNIEILSSNVSPDVEITGVCYDSRQVASGNLFVAVSGYQTDGHRFIPAAYKAGAAAIVCERVEDENIPYVQVSSSRAALAMLGANWFGHPADSMKILGITGTNGKTSSTILLKSVLEQAAGAKVGLLGTIQNMIGDTVIPTERTTPESFEIQKLFAEMRDAGCTHVVMEVSSHALVLNRVDGIRFAVGAFTNLTEDHLDFHKTMEEYRKAKALLFRKCGVGIFNIDDAMVEKTISESDCRVIRTSREKPEADIRASGIVLMSDHIEMDVSCCGEAAHVTVPIPGEFTVYNALTVIGCAYALGIRVEDTAKVLSGVKGVCGRIEVVPTPGKPYTVLIDYAHTPDALDNVLRSVRGFCKGRLIALFGCGGDRDPIKRPIMGRIAMDLADLVVVTSDNPRTEEPAKIIEDILAGTVGYQTPIHVEADRPKAIRWAMDEAGENDIIVLAGKGHETYQERGRQKFHLDEREEVAAHLAETGASE